MKIAIKTDRFKKNRGGYSRFLSLSCGKCKNQIAFYQKDGPGILKRLYLDRIHGRGNLSAKNLICQNCKTLLGVFMVYKKENRPAYRLFAGAVEKKIVKSESLPEIK